MTQQRPSLLHALLTIARACYARGKPAAAVPSLGNHGEWARTVGGMLALAGVEGFLGNLTQLWSEADQSATEWEPFLRAWVSELTGEKTAADIYGCVRWRHDSEGMTCLAPKLRDTLPGDLPDALDKPGSFTRKLGTALKGQTDARYGDEQYRVVFCGQDPHSKVALWKVVHE